MFFLSALISQESGRAKPKTGFHKDYVVGRRLGSGSYSTVRDAICVRTKENVAVKIVTKMALTQEDLDALYVEVEVLRKVRQLVLFCCHARSAAVPSVRRNSLFFFFARSFQLQHRNVVQLKAFYEDADRFYLVMENMKGGELLRQIEKRTRYTEADAKVVVATLLTAIKFCHDRGVVHRDLKVSNGVLCCIACRPPHTPTLSQPENILLTDDSPNAEIKLADFGFAHTFVVGSNELRTCLGTPG